MTLDEQAQEALATATRTYNERTGSQWTEQEFLHRTIAWALGLVTMVPVESVKASLHCTLDFMLKVLAAAPADRLQAITGEILDGSKERIATRIAAIEDRGDFRDLKGSVDK